MERRVRSPARISSRAAPAAAPAVSRRLRRVGRWLALVLLAIAVALTFAAAVYDAVTPGGKPARSLYAGPFVRVDGRLLAYRRWGTHGSPVVLLGGFIEPN